MNSTPRWLESVFGLRDGDSDIDETDDDDDDEGSYVDNKLTSNNNIKEETVAAVGVPDGQHDAHPDQGDTVVGDAPSPHGVRVQELFEELRQRHAVGPEMLQSMAEREWCLERAAQENDEFAKVLDDSEDLLEESAIEYFREILYDRIKTAEVEKILKRRARQQYTIAQPLERGPPLADDADAWGEPPMWQSQSIKLRPFSAANIRRLEGCPVEQKKCSKGLQQLRRNIQVSPVERQARGHGAEPPVPHKVDYRNLLAEQQAMMDHQDRTKGTYAEVLAQHFRRQDVLLRALQSPLVVQEEAPQPQAAVSPLPASAFGVQSWLQQLPTEATPPPQAALNM